MLTGCRSQPASSRPARACARSHPRTARPDRLPSLPWLLRSCAGTGSARPSSCWPSASGRQTTPTICLREDGSLWPPRRVLTYAFARLIRASGLTKVRLHDLRHGHATHLLVANTHPEVVQERLGHANIQLTLDTYSHVLPSMQEDATTTIDAAMRAALKRR